MFFCDVGQVAPRLDSSASDGANGWDAARHREEIVVINRTRVQVAKVIALLFASVGAHLGHAQGQNTLPFADPQIKGALAQISAGQIEFDIEKLVSFQTRSTISTQDASSIAAGRGIGAHGARGSA